MALSASVKALNDRALAPVIARLDSARGLFVPADAERERLELLRLPLVAVDETGETEVAS